VDKSGIIVQGNKPVEYIEDNYLNELTKQETIRILYQAVKKLPPQSREVIQHSLTGKNNNEIVDAMGISLNTVKTHKKTAYRILRDKLLPDIFILLLLVCTFE
jgi:RNA polymerase sigma factor (sigma-70 family)